MKKIVLYLTLLFATFFMVGCSPFWGEDARHAGDEGQALKPTVSEKEEPVFPLDLNGDKQPVNVLLIGSDQREDEIARADVLMVARYTPQSSSVKIISIMRDTFVDIPGYEKSKINHAYSWGGEELLAETIRKNFNLEIHHTVKVDFKNFINIMDLIFPDGVQVSVSEPMIDYWNWSKDSGRQVLKGNEILQYVRFRSDNENDFGRVKRQQEIMTLAEESMIKKMQSGQGLVDVAAIMRECLKNVETETPISEIMKYGFSMMVNPIDTVDTLRVPIEGSFSDLSTPNAGLVLNMDVQRNMEAIRDFLSNTE
ncbi:LytR family transcriptional regulator [Bacillus sp. BHET2]|uniref:LCP family protein n=1 Tax=Bacillus sp. BHET2 TaxID=2583818 RepID=UPI00110DC12D|nr:LCP family protein [Bacillus sp. BHET2]TMU86871.1 LytR family transcriptional regulator [Bacillus sp. BHET2]